MAGVASFNDADDYLRRRPYLKMYGAGFSFISLSKSIVSQIRANGFFSTKAVSEGDKRIGSFESITLFPLNESAGTTTGEFELNCVLNEDSDDRFC